MACCSRCLNEELAGLVPREHIGASCAPCAGVSWQGAGPVHRITSPGGPTLRYDPRAPSLAYTHGPRSIRNPRRERARAFNRAFNRGASVGLPVPSWVLNPSPRNPVGPDGERPPRPAAEDECMGWAEVGIATIAGVLIGAIGGYAYGRF